MDVEDKTATGITLFRVFNLIGAGLKLKVFLDEEEVGHLTCCSHLFLPVQAGDHHVQVITETGSARSEPFPVHVSQDQNVELYCHYRFRGWWLVLLPILLIMALCYRGNVYIIRERALNEKIPDPNKFKRGVAVVLAFMLTPLLTSPVVYIMSSLADLAVGVSEQMGSNPLKVWLELFFTIFFGGTLILYVISLVACWRWLRRYFEDNPIF